jgi:hypothetical protein
MKKILACSILLLLAFITQANAQELGWKLLKEVEGVRVEYQVRDYAPNHSQYYVLRVKNTNSHDVAINWDYRLNYNNGQEVYNPKSGEHHVGLILKAGQSTAGNLPKTDEDNLLTLHYRFTGERGKMATTALTDIKLELFKIFIL